MTMAQYPYCCMKKKAKIELKATQRLKEKQLIHTTSTPVLILYPSTQSALWEAIMNKLSNMISKLQENKLNHTTISNILIPY